MLKSFLQIHLPEVMSMVFCSKCGEKLSDDANFCIKCGVRTGHGAEANVPFPAEEWRDALVKVGQEIEGAFSTAAKEVQKAFKTVKENVTESSSRRLVVCESCGQQTAAESIYCTKCGKKL
jgi:ribosomal protein L40E